MSKVTAIIQARMSSSRLPGKVLMEAGGAPMLKHVVDRAARCTQMNAVIVATSLDVQDDPVAEFCGRERMSYYRGSEDDVLDRYYQAARNAKADIVVRITGDCPLIDPDVIGKAVHLFNSGEFDYVSNVYPPTYPDGLDVEVVSMAALETAWHEAVRPMDREHVTCFVSENKDHNRFRRGNIENSRNLSRYRLTVDDVRDVQVVRAILDHFGNDRCSMDEIIKYLDDHPEIMAVNAAIERNEGSKADYLDPKNQI